MDYKLLIENISLFQTDADVAWRINADDKDLVFQLLPRSVQQFSEAAVSTSEGSVSGKEWDRERARHFFQDSPGLSKIRLSTWSSTVMSWGIWGRTFRGNHLNCGASRCAFMCQFRTRWNTHQRNLGCQRHICIPAFSSTYQTSRWRVITLRRSGMCCGGTGMGQQNWSPSERASCTPMHSAEKSPTWDSPTFYQARLWIFMDMFSESFDHIL